MKSDNKVESNKHSDLRRIRLALLALVPSLCVLGGITYLNQQAAQGRYVRPPQQVPDMAPELQKARLEKATRLRDQWKSWAIQHKAELQHMLHGDQSAQVVVWKALPSWPMVNGLFKEDVSGGVWSFSWQPVIKGPIFDRDHDPVKTRKLREKYKAQAEELLGDGFRLYKDIPLSQSGNSGAKTISLWASGRITETETVLRPRVPGQPVFKEVSREILPPYEFLD